jgi:DNA-binding Lrp family transcriptional regulator
LHRASAELPEVIGAWYVTGDYDFVRRVVARNMAGFKTLVAFRNVKPLSGIPAARD